MSEPLPVRYCHGCQAFDDHPRVTHIADQNRPDLDKLYHYDCLPPEASTEPLQPIIGARAGGARGAELREFAGQHAASITEAPADDVQKG
jgi:hypothetical protein